MVLCPRIEFQIGSANHIALGLTDSQTLYRILEISGNKQRPGIIAAVRTTAVGIDGSPLVNHFGSLVWHGMHLKYTAIVFLKDKEVDVLY